MTLRNLAAFVAVTLPLAACDAGMAPEEATPDLGVAGARAADVASLVPLAGTGEDDLVAWAAGANAALEAGGFDVRVHEAQWLAAPGAEEIGRTVFFSNVGNKQLGADFVPDDPRRTWSVPGGVTYFVDQSDGGTLSGLTNAQTEPAIDRAMATWEAELCSDLGLTKVADDGLDHDRIDGGPYAGPIADMVHAGWLPIGGSTLGVTFTLIFVGPDGPTDIDGNGLADVAFREIFYNTLFVWDIGGNIDVETVALHEAGHGLSQGHFGTLFSTDSNGKFHFSPLAVMNAGYTQVQQSLRGTDSGGHCSIWGSR